MKKKRFLFFISILFAFSMFLFGCSENAQGSSDIQKYIPKETVTLNIFSNVTGYSGMQTGWFADVMKEKFNIKLNIVPEKPADEGNQFMEDYDIIMCGSYMGEQYTEARDKGYFLDLSSMDMVTLMPYVSEYLQESYVRYTDDTGEHIYGIFASTSLPTDIEYSGHYLWEMKFDYYKELGLPKINDLNDWANVLAQMKANYPTNGAGKETYGITYCAGMDEGMLRMVEDFVCAYYGYEPNGLGFYDCDSKKYYAVLGVDENGNYGPYLEMLEFCNKLYRQGLIDPESDTQDYEEAAEKVRNSQVFASVISLFGSLNVEEMYPVIPQEANIMAWSLGRSNRSISIDSGTKYPELCMAIVDYLYSPEGMLTLLYGPQGECWDYDEEGYAYLTEAGVKFYYNFDEPFKGEGFRDGDPKFNILPFALMATNTKTGEPYDFLWWKNTVSDAANEVEYAWKEWTKASSVENYIHGFDNYKVAGSGDRIDFSETELSAKYEAVSSIIISKSWEAIKAPTDEEFDQIVQDMITSATQAGYEECVGYCEDFVEKVEE
ncbi:MAG: hypothetical protein E7261_09790 [Lachnospiraceae bacterium]|nr:hypothetical protein [Lachnospiraceae bacterium]